VIFQISVFCLIALCLIGPGAAEAVGTKVDGLEIPIFKSKIKVEKDEI
jgi:hypothetical protein